MQHINNIKRVLPVLFGNCLETYDFCLYGLLAVYFSKVFFPQNSNYALAFSFSIFSVAYIARPIGSILWGHIADKYGRKKVMIGTLSLMVVPAVGMACMPSYEAIGATATVLVVLCRFLQGIAFGGESSTVIVSLYELAPNGRKGLYGSLYDPGSSIGYLVAMIFIIILSDVVGEDIIYDYGWRFLFGISLIFIFILGYFRKQLIETSKIQYRSSLPFVSSIKNDWKAIVKIVLYLSGSTAMFYSLFFHNYLIIYAQKFGIKTMFAQVVIVLTTIFMMPFFGYMSDKVNRIKLLKLSYPLIIIMIYPLYYLFLTENIVLMISGYFVFALLTSVVCATFPAVIVPQVSKECRVTSIGVAFSLSVIAGSFLPATNEFIKYTTGNNFAPVIVIIVCSLISFVMLFTFDRKNYK